MATEPITGETYQEAGSLQTDALQNSMLNYFGAWVNCAALTIGDAAPPGSPANGDCYIVGAGTAAWTGHDDELAVYRDGWQFYLPKEGAQCLNLDDGFRYAFLDGEWGTVVAAAGDASTIAYDNTTSGLSADNAQAAIDEIAALATPDGKVAIVTEASAFTAVPATHAGVHAIVLAGGDVTFDNAESYESGHVFNITATAGIELIEDGVTLTPPAGGTLELDADMSVTVLMTGATAGRVIGQTVPV